MAEFQFRVSLNFLCDCIHKLSRNLDHNFDNVPQAYVSLFVDLLQVRQSFDVNELCEALDMMSDSLMDDALPLFSISSDAGAKRTTLHF